MNTKGKFLYNTLAVFLILAMALTSFSSCHKPKASSQASISFYKKLNTHQDVNILITGDSIGFGAGTQSKGKEWFTLLEGYLEKEYKNNVTIKNVSLSAGTSYTTYYNLELTDYYEFNGLSNKEPVNYDLVIICSGHNDEEKDFSKYYETIIRSVFKKYPKASIITVLQSSQRTYTEKINAIKELSDYYNIPTVDMIKPFMKRHRELTIDYVHPNDKGQQFYFENISRAISDFTKKGIESPTFKEPLNSESLKFSNFKFFAQKEFKRTDDLTYTMDLTCKGALGIDYFVKNKNSKAKIYIDQKLFYAPTANIDSKEYKRNVVLVLENTSIKNNIKIVFQSKKQADLFKGIAISKKQ